MTRARNLLLLFLMLLVSSAVTVADGLAEGDSTRSAAITKNVLSLLNPAQQKLYNGYEYLGFKFDVKRGHPYFKSHTWTNSHLEYDGIQYANIPVLYDLVQDELVMEHLNKTASMALVRAKVKQFSLLGHTFVYLQPAFNATAIGPAGFYEQLFSSPESKVFGKYSKTVDGVIPEDGTVAYFREKANYYIQRGNDFYQIKNRRDVLKVFPDRRKEIDQFMKDYDLSVSKDPVDALMEVAQYYSKLQQ